MDNNYPQNNPYNANQGYPQQPTTPQYNPQYPGVAPQPTAVPETTTYSNPYATADPYATTNPYAPTDPYATTNPYAPTDPYATTNPYATTDPYATTNPYGAPAPAPKKSKKGLIIGLIAGGVVIIGVVVALLLYFNSDSYKYGEAKDLMKAGKYDDAITAFTEIKDYEDSSKLIDECKYKKAEELLKDKKYDEAREIFEELGDYEDSADKLVECDYEKACILLSEGNYEEASALFDGIDYKDSYNKFIESNRRMLYEYLDDNGGSVTYYASEDVYKLVSTDDDKIDIMRLGENSGFSIRFDMTSDVGTFLYVWYYDDSDDTDTTRGDCVLSELTTQNDLVVDSYTGDTYMMDELTDSNCNMTCMYLDDLLNKTDLDLSPADIGFTSL